MYLQTGFCGVLGFLGPRRINNLPVFRAQRRFDSVPGHHQHYTLIAAKKVDIPANFQDLSVWSFFRSEKQLWSALSHVRRLRVTPLPRPFSISCRQMAGPQAAAS
jgi:hypothetical protein